MPNPIPVRHPLAACHLLIQSKQIGVWCLRWPAVPVRRVQEYIGSRRLKKNKQRTELRLRRELRPHCKPRCRETSVPHTMLDAHRQHYITGPPIHQMASIHAQTNTIQLRQYTPTRQQHITPTITLPPRHDCLPQALIPPGHFTIPLRRSAQSQTRIGVVIQDTHANLHSHNLLQW